METNTNTNNKNNDPGILSQLDYAIAYKDSTLTVTLTKQQNDSFTIDLKFKIPKRHDIDEVIHRLCSFKEEQFLMLEIQEIELITSKSTTASIYSLFKCLVNYDESFKNSLRRDLDSFIKSQNQAYYDSLVKNALAENLFDNGI
jgi:hypothetical protein